VFFWGEREDGVSRHTARLLRVYVEVLVRGEGKREGVVRITLDLMGGERGVC
jgi:hypothetical protein